jgi:hypothetical protein
MPPGLSLIEDLPFLEDLSQKPVTLREAGFDFSGGVDHWRNGQIANDVPQEAAHLEPALHDTAGIIPHDEEVDIAVRVRGAVSV